MSTPAADTDRLLLITTYELYQYLKDRGNTIRHTDILRTIDTKFREEPGWYGSLNNLPPRLHQKQTIKIKQPMMPNGYHEIQVYALTGSQATALAADIDIELLTTIVTRVTTLEQSRILDTEISPAQMQEGYEAYLQWKSAGRSPTWSREPVKWVGNRKVFFYTKDRYLDADGSVDPTDAEFYRSSVGCLYDQHWGDKYQQFITNGTYS